MNREIIITIIFCIHFGNVIADINMKSSMVENIVQKISNISLSSLNLNNITQEEKNRMLSNIEEKLKVSSAALGDDGRMYNKIIIRSLKSMLFNNTKEVKATTYLYTYNNITVANKAVMPKESSNKNVIGSKELKKDFSKNELIQNIVSKLKRFALKLSKDKIFRSVKNSFIDKIKNNTTYTFKGRKQIDQKSNNLYTELIAEGIDLMIKHISKSNDLKDTRRKYTDASEAEAEPEKIKRMLKYTTPYTQKPSKLNIKCGNVIDKTCAKLKSLQNYVCRYDKTELPLDRICNRIKDCLDQSDEQNCVETAIEKIKRAGDIVTNLETYVSNQCLAPDVGSMLFTSQNQVLRNVLKSQLDYLETSSDSTNIENYNFEKEFNNDTIKRLSNEAVLVVGSLAMALEGSLCTRRFGLDDIDEIAIRYSDTDADEELDRVLNKVAWSPKACLCTGPVCQLKDCPELCKRICWQRFNLNRWTCHAIDTGPSISLDYICDGKYDCYDETDESDCILEENYGKLNSVLLYTEILKNIKKKTKEKKYGIVLAELLTLHDTVLSLQQLSIDTDVDIMNVKIAREQYFSTIKDIYERFLVVVRTIPDLNEVYDYMMLLNRKLVEALKKSHTGNEKIYPTDGCTCKGNRCVLLRCSQSCKRTCAVQHMFTKYSCDRKMSQFVPIEELCNGFLDCSNGEDESSCQKDVCRVHHLVLIRHNIQNVGQKYKGTALGEALDVWKTKATNTLLMTERNGRPNRKTIEDVVADILKDLIKSYASVEDHKRISNDSNLKMFFKISQQIIGVLKTCRN